MRAKASIVIIGVLIGIDQVTKQTFPAVRSTPHVPVIIGGTLILALIYWLYKSHSRPITQSALSLVVAGGIGNSIDQLAYGIVRDIAHIGTLHFNVADLYIIFGSLMMMLGIYSTRTKKRQISTQNIA